MKRRTLSINIHNTCSRNYSVSYNKNKKTVNISGLKGPNGSINNSEQLKLPGKMPLGIFLVSIR